MSDLVIDEAVLYKTLKLSKGCRKTARVALDRAGIEITEKEISDAIKKSSILNAYFGSNSPIVHDKGLDPEEALLRLPNDSVAEENLSKVVAIQDEYIAAKGLKGVGFSDTDIQEMESMAQFVGHGFKKTIDLTHGVMVVQLWKLKKRADEIQEILNNDEQKERIHVSERGDIVRYVTDRFSDNEKLEWQKELTNIIDQIRRIADSSNNAAALRMKAEMAVREIEKKPTRKAKKLRVQPA